MGPSSGRAKGNPTTNVVASFRVADIFEIKPSFGLAVTGLVLVLESFRPVDPESLIGEPVQIRHPGGWTISGEIAGVRDHGPTCSILLRGWPEEFAAPRVGWRVEIPTFASEVRGNGGDTHG